MNEATHQINKRTVVLPAAIAASKGFIALHPINIFADIKHPMIEPAEPIKKGMAHAVMISLFVLLLLLLLLLLILLASVSSMDELFDVESSTNARLAGSSFVQQIS